MCPWPLAMLAIWATVGIGLVLLGGAVNLTKLGWEASSGDTAIPVASGWEVSLGGHCDPCPAATFAGAVLMLKTITN